MTVGASHRLLPAANLAELVAAQRDALAKEFDDLATTASRYTVGNDCLLIVSRDDGTKPRRLAWLTGPGGILIIFLCTESQDWTEFTPLFGQEGWPAFAAFELHEDVLSAWDSAAQGGPAGDGQHHHSRRFCRYAAACARNERARRRRAAAPRPRPRRSPQASQARKRGRRK